MVCLTPRFVFLAALVATAAMPSFVLQSDARAIDLAARHHVASDKPTTSALPMATTKGKGRGKPTSKPTIPLPLSTEKASSGKKSKKQSKGSAEDEKRAVSASEVDADTWDPLDPLLQVGNVGLGDGRDSSYSDTHHLIGGILVRNPEPHHHHHHHDRRDEYVQVPFGIAKRAASRFWGKRDETEQDVYDSTVASMDDTWDPTDPVLQIGNFKVGDGRGSTYSDTHHLISKRAPHHHDHHDHDKVVVNGDNDDVHVHERRAPHHHGDHDHVVVNGDNDHAHYDRRSPHHHGHHDHDKTVINGDNDDVHIHERRAPHHHHDHDDHDKTVVNGDNDDVHIHERRAPHHHHHGDNDKTVVNGDNDDVHIHERRAPHHHHDHYDHDKVVVNGDNDDVHVHQRDFMDVDVGLHLGDGCEMVNGRYVNCPDASSYQQKRSDAVDGMPGVPGTVDIMMVGGALDQKLASLILSSVPDNSTSSNTTEATSDPDASPFILDASNSTTTQFFLVVNPPAGSAVTPGAADTLSAIKSATLSNAVAGGVDKDASDIKVSLQVSVFEPSEAAMRPYCATFDPNPPTPAPLSMEKCFTDMEASGNSTSKSQTFAYNPVSGIIRPMWFSVSASPDAASNSTDSSTNSTTAGSSNSASGVDDKQMNFKFPTSNKDADVPAPIASAPQAINSTASSMPAPASGQNVTLVFTPAGPVVQAVNNPTGVASFEPSDGTDASANDVSSASASDSMSSTMSMSSSDVSSTSSTDSMTSTMSALSDSSSATTTDSSSAMPTDSTSATSTDSDSGVLSVSTDQADTQSTMSADSSASNATDVISASASSTDSDSMMPTSTSGDSSVPMPSSTVDQAAIEKMFQQDRLRL